MQLSSSSGRTMHASSHSRLGGVSRHAALAASPLRPPPPPRARLQVSAGPPGTPSALDRVIAALPYALPYCAVYTYGRFVYRSSSLVVSLIEPTMPLISAYYSVQFASLIAFFAVLFGLANNTQMSRFVRFNAMQALLLDVVLALPRLVEGVFPPPTFGWGSTLYANCSTALWFAVIAAILYGLYGCVRGWSSAIPFIADAADQQLR